MIVCSSDLTKLMLIRISDALRFPPGLCHRIETSPPWGSCAGWYLQLPSSDPPMQHELPQVSASVGRTKHRRPRLGRADSGSVVSSLDRSHHRVRVLEARALAMPTSSAAQVERLTRSDFPRPRSKRQTAGSVRSLATGRQRGRGESLPTNLQTHRLRCHHYQLQQHRLIHQSLPRSHHSSTGSAVR